MHGARAPVRPRHGARRTRPASAESARTSSGSYTRLLRLACQSSDALRSRPCKTFGMVAQRRRRCPSMGWCTVTWPAVLRAWAPFMVDAFEATQERAFVHRTPTVAPLALNLCCVCAACDRRRRLLLLWTQDRRVDTARRCGSLLYTGLHGTSCGALGTIGRFGRSTRCLDSVGFMDHGGIDVVHRSGYLVLCGLLTAQASRARVVCFGRGPGARGRCTYSVVQGAPRTRGVVLRRAVH